MNCTHPKAALTAVLLVCFAGAAFAASPRTLQEAGGPLEFSDNTSLRVFDYKVVAADETLPVGVIITVQFSVKNTGDGAEQLGPYGCAVDYYEPPGIEDGEKRTTGLDEGLINCKIEPGQAVPVSARLQLNHPGHWDIVPWVSIPPERADNPTMLTRSFRPVGVTVGAGADETSDESAEKRDERAAKDGWKTKYFITKNDRPQFDLKGGLRVECAEVQVKKWPLHPNDSVRVKVDLRNTTRQTVRFTDGMVLYYQSPRGRKAQPHQWTKGYAGGSNTALRAADTFYYRRIMELDEAGNWLLRPCVWYSANNRTHEDELPGVTVPVRTLSQGPPEGETIQPPPPPTDEHGQVINPQNPEPDREPQPPPADIPQITDLPYESRARVSVDEGLSITRFQISGPNQACAEVPLRCEFDVENSGRTTFTCDSTYYAYVGYCRPNSTGGVWQRAREIKDRAVRIAPGHKQRFTCRITLQDDGPWIFYPGFSMYEAIEDERYDHPIRRAVFAPKYLHAVRVEANPAVSFQVAHSGGSVLPENTWGWTDSLFNSDPNRTKMQLFCCTVSNSQGSATDVGGEHEDSYRTPVAGLDRRASQMRGLIYHEFEVTPGSENDVFRADIAVHGRASGVIQRMSTGSAGPLGGTAGGGFARILGGFIPRDHYTGGNTVWEAHCRNDPVWANWSGDPDDCRDPVVREMLGFSGLALAEQVIGTQCPPGVMDVVDTATTAALNMMYEDVIDVPFTLKFRDVELVCGEKYRLFILAELYTFESSVGVLQAAWTKVDFFNRAPYVTGESIDSNYLPDRCIYLDHPTITFEQGFIPRGE